MAGMRAYESDAMEGIGCPGEVPERTKGADCKSAGSAFGGSNPPLSIISESLQGPRCAKQKAEAKTEVRAGMVKSQVRGRELLGRGFGIACLSCIPGPARESRAGIAQMARASAFQAEGCGFEPRFPLQGANPRMDTLRIFSRRGDWGDSFFRKSRAHVAQR
jgi:hypothetical protein